MQYGAEQAVIHSLQYDQYFRVYLKLGGISLWSN